MRNNTVKILVKAWRTHTKELRPARAVQARVHVGQGCADEIACADVGGPDAQPLTPRPVERLEESECLTGRP